MRVLRYKEKAIVYRQHVTVQNLLIKCNKSFEYICLQFLRVFFVFVHLPSAVVLQPITPAPSVEWSSVARPSIIIILSDLSKEFQGKRVCDRFKERCRTGLSPGTAGQTGVTRDVGRRDHHRSHPRE